MTPLAYAGQIVVPTAIDAMKNPADKRLAYLTCIAVYHLLDYLALASITETKSNRERKEKCEEAAKDIRTRMEARCPSEFKAVGDICNGLKHPARAIRPEDAVIEIPRFKSGIMGSVFYVGPGMGPSLAVQVDGKLIFLDQCIMTVLETFRDLYPDKLMASAALDEWRRGNSF
ncbi:hypothetical protein FV226_25495 [Methylobacterium sp. WL12]|uniref:hypothetical protein n=1 Tax=Methylobacterium sp. WL12 TaxID=2603890 RepID=UPI0011C96ED6|nr:hypothetical protein [Methylobacterium sp. WL12]TXM65148.1 hypothetical protein FV226_25495 [Methylobacterium sp. WL12]